MSSTVTLSQERGPQTSAAFASRSLQVHLWFISITVGIFGSTTWRFAGELSTGGNPVLVWLAGCIGLYWGIRAVLQWSCYSSSHWRGHLVRTSIHILSTLGYGGLSLLYAVVWSGN